MKRNYPRKRKTWAAGNRASDRRGERGSGTAGAGSPRTAAAGQDPHAGAGCAASRARWKPKPRQEVADVSDLMESISESCREL